MPLTPGQTLAHYEILGPLGAGGMGEVYRARDTRLEREVAIKVLPEEVADDEERLRRFEREAKTLASLSHANLAHVYGIDQEGDTCFIAMELVSGEDLAARLARGALPVNEAIDVCRQIAEGLEAAHEAGVVHRDLKPANVRITPDGVVKLLDFGLAKPMHPRRTRDGTTSAEPDSFLVTEEGLVLGTPTYMSPEQARGKPIGKRVDLWAFGCVLFECLTARRAFAGESMTDVLAAVVGSEPDWRALPDETPSCVRRLLRRCLAKDARQRLDSAGAARIELDDARNEGAESAVSDLRRAAGSSGSSGGGGWRIPALTGATGIGLGALLAALLADAGEDGRGPLDTETPARLRETQVPLLEGTPLYAEGRPLAISPDGEKIVFSAGMLTDTRLYRRRLDSFEIEPIPGTEGGRNPFFSPDGEWLAFVDAEQLKKVSVGAGTVKTLCEAPVSTSPGAWTDDGWIYFTYDEMTLARVREEGGERQDFLDFDTLSLAALPNGRILIGPHELTGLDRSFTPVLIANADGETRELLPGYSPAFLGSSSSSAGFLLVVRGDELFAAPFDADRGEVKGEARRVRGGLRTDSIWGWARYAVSTTGTLVYVPGVDAARTVPTWIDRVSGAEEPVRGMKPAVRNTFELSPDDTRLVYQACGEIDEVELFDLELGTTTRLSREGGAFPVWSADGEDVFYEVFHPLALVRVAADRSREPVRIPIPPIATTPTGRVVPADKDWMDPTSPTPDGEFLVTMRFGPDLWLLPLDGGEAAVPKPLLATPGSDILGTVSPDGNWIVYQSNEGGDYAVYVAPFPSLAWSRPVSVGRGDDARWSPLGGELFYRDFNRIYRVEYTATATEFHPQPAEPVLDVEFHNALGLSFDVSRDGRRFLVQKPLTSFRADPPLVVVEGWLGEVERLVQGR